MIKDEGLCERPGRSIGRSGSVCWSVDQSFDGRAGTLLRSRVHVI